MMMVMIMVMHMVMFVAMAVTMSFFLMVMMVAVVMVLMAVTFLMIMMVAVAMFTFLMVVVMTMAVFSFLVVMVFLMVMGMFHSHRGRSVEVGHIMVVIFMFCVQNDVEIAAVDTRFLDPGNFDFKTFGGNGGKRFFQHFLIGSEVQERCHKHISADAGGCFEIKLFTH